MLEYGLCEGDGLRGKEEKETEGGEGGNNSQCPLCMSGLSLFSSDPPPTAAPLLSSLNVG